ncbi:MULTISPECIES: type IV secretion system protein [Lysobacter]|uniref:Type IV secretion system protein n=1 Tax=Lysobacter gummosus TaxID=262324 RepID=A0ABY3X8D8_9GAMM|nr:MULTISPECIES: type IV secretion system protein [Lysobacter]ALN91772.1 trbL/VirB6 plasmid conjugal transfer family protein [Lysobacter gummosus]UJB21223.1 type IV secretion system protein [Lysobacter capsici]UJQ29661.1 type IV secretion system protein [Lysobacter gummosus]UNP27442.1 type IV secretion system protein [Lysobacter gummosus]
MDIHTVSLGAGSLLDWMDMQTAALQNMEFFTLIKDHLDKMILKFQTNLLKRVGQLIGAVAATVVTLWIVVQGFRIATGQSREPMMALVVNSLRSVLIVGVALTTAVTANTTYGALTDGVSHVIRETVTGRDDDGPYADMDQVLAILQAGLDLVGSVDVGEDVMTNDTKNKAMNMIGVGLGGPVIMAMIAMMLNKIAMALFIGMGPFFILCLLFDQTKALFQKWLFYGLATMMSMAVLIVMTTISIDLILAVGAAFWVTELIPGVGDKESIMNLALQQGGLGTILSALIITAPPMAGAFFNGVMGQFSPYNAFQPASGGNNYPAPGQQYPQQAPPVAQAPRESGVHQGRRMS